jgi:hypothetical protein
VTRGTCHRGRRRRITSSALWPTRRRLQLRVRRHLQAHRRFLRLRLQITASASTSTAAAITASAAREYGRGRARSSRARFARATCKLSILSLHNELVCAKKLLHPHGHVVEAACDGDSVDMRVCAMCIHSTCRGGVLQQKKRGKARPSDGSRPCWSTAARRHASTPARFTPKLSRCRETAAIQRA